VLLSRNSEFDTGELFKRLRRPDSERASDRRRGGGRFQNSQNWKEKSANLADFLVPVWSRNSSNVPLLSVISTFSLLDLNRLDL
jgi:hypothetical protein